MLAYILAIAIGLGSFALYMAAFFFPEVHRKSDFVWSGVGFFYALILWACAGQITGAVLLGQVASVSLLVWFGWEILALRRAATPVAQQTPIPADVKQRLNGFLGRQSSVISPESTPKINIVKPPEPVSPINTVIPETPVDHLRQPEPKILSTSPDVAEVGDETVVEEPPIPSITQEESIPEISVEETPETPTVEPTSPSPTASLETPKKAEKKKEKPVVPGGTTPKTVSKPQKSIPALIGMLSGMIGNFTGLLKKKPKTKTPKPTTDHKPKSPEPDPVSPASTVVEATTSDSQTVPVDSEFAEFEDLEPTVSPTADVVDRDTSTEPEATEAVEKPTPSPFEQIATPQVKVIVEETQESVTEEIPSVVDPVEPESIEEVIVVSENETPAETTASEETTPPPLVRPHPPNPDLKAAAQKPTDSNSPSESKPE